MTTHCLKNSKDPNYFEDAQIQWPKESDHEQVLKQQPSLNHKNFWPRIKIQTKTKDKSAISTKADILVEGIEITKDDPMWKTISISAGIYPIILLNIYTLRQPNAAKKENQHYH